MSSFYGQRRLDRLPDLVRGEAIFPGGLCDERGEAPLKRLIVNFVHSLQPLSLSESGRSLFPHVAGPIPVAEVFTSHHRD